MRETIKDKLVRIETKLDFVEQLLKNHLKHHWMVELALLGAIVTFVLSKGWKWLVR